jgi:acetylornithine deacetylase/succinyl-diaminopimelate desuccinylase-like protein
MNRALKLLRELVALPSVNPAFLPAGDPRAGERRVAEFLAATGAKWGLDVHFQPVTPGRANVWLRLAPPEAAIQQRVLLAPHMDTVGGETTPDGLFHPRIKEGRLYGRGACDDKGCLAAMLAALIEAAAAGYRPKRTEILFLGLVDEENAQLGSRAVADSGLRADLAIVGEPTRLRVITAHKGNLWLRLKTSGKAAHGSRPELGQNAILRMAKIVQVLETEYQAELRQRRHPLLRPPTVNVGAIGGGVQPNIVPAHCAITIDRRTLPGETDAAVCREITRFLRARQAPCVLENTKAHACLPMETDPRKPLVSQFMKTAGQQRPLGADYFCDASVLSASGIPSVVFGPGDIAQAHTDDEWISLADLERATRTLLRFLRSLP